MLALDSGQIWWTRDLSSYRGVDVDEEQMYCQHLGGRAGRAQAPHRRRSVAQRFAEAAQPFRARGGGRLRRGRGPRGLRALVRSRHRRGGRARQDRRRSRHQRARCRSMAIVYVISDKGDIVALHGLPLARAAPRSAGAGCRRTGRRARPAAERAATDTLLQMLPVIAIVGRPNVGKSTLFNTLTQTRDAIVADVPGVTRDRQYGYGRLGPVQYVCIDTGGLVENPSGMDALMRIQTEHAIKEADRLIFVADARAGLTTAGSVLRERAAARGQAGVPRREQGRGAGSAAWPARISTASVSVSRMPSAATHGFGCEELMDIVLAGFPPAPPDEREPKTAASASRSSAGPNVGKSTLINRLIGEERLITSEVAGTTRDSILVPFERDGREFTLIDTAGVRRRAQDRRRSRNPVGVEDAAGHRRGARRHDGGRRAGFDRRAGRERAGPRAVARPRADPRRQQVGQHSHRAARRHPPPAHAQDRFRAVCAAAFRQRAAWHGRGRPGRRR